jgi:hypothetical protein
LIVGTYKPCQHSTEGLCVVTALTRIQEAVGENMPWVLTAWLT